MTDRSSSSGNPSAGATAATTTGVAMINPHNPEFITKRPWYLGNDGGAPTAAAATAAVSISAGGAIGLDHQAADVRLEKLPRSLEASEAILEQERLHQQQLTSTQSLQVGMWLEALKRNKPPYRMGKVIKIGQTSHTGKTIVDIQFEDGSLERHIPTSRLRWTKAGSRATTVDAALHGKETYDSKRDKYHGYDKDIHNVQLERKFATRDELRRQQLRQQQQDEAKNKKNNNEDNEEKEEEEEGKDSNNKDKDKTGDGNNKTTVKTKKKQEYPSDSDSDSDHDPRDNDNDNSDFSEDEFVQRDEDAKVHTSRLARQGGVGGAQMKVTARNLRIREDTAKYLRNLNLNSAYYDPKSRSMRDNPNPQQHNDGDGGEEEAAFVGDNFTRISGDAIKLAETQLFAWQATEQALDADGGGGGVGGGSVAELHPQANPTQAELLQRQFKSTSANVKLEQKKAVLAKYGGAEYLDGTDGLAKAVASTEQHQQQQHDKKANTTSGNDNSTPASLAAERKIRFGVSTMAEEYTRDGRKKTNVVDSNNNNSSIKRVAIPSKYEEDVFVNGHATVWGSYFHVGAFKWGYADDHSLIKNSYCTGANGRLANDEANEMQYGTGVIGSAALAQARGMLQQQKKMLPPKAATAIATAAITTTTTTSAARTDIPGGSSSSSSKLYGETDNTKAINLDQDKLQQALKKEEELRKQEASDRKRKYNSLDTQVDVTQEEMEAYRLRKERSSDPMAKLANGDELLDYQ